MIFASTEGHMYLAVSDGFAPFSGVVIVILIVARETLKVGARLMLN